jgi:hypothetical protein
MVWLEGFGATTLQDTLAHFHETSMFVHFADGAEPWAG